jgi:hypothetical protein
MTRATLNLPEANSDQWGVVINKNFILIDEEFQRISTELLGGVSEFVVGLNNTKTKLTNFENIINVINTLELGKLEMYVKTNTITDSHKGSFLSLDETANRWLSAGATPYILADGIVTASEYTIYCLIGGRPYRICRQGETWTIDITKEYMIIASNSDILGLADKRRRSYPSLGGGSGSTFYCPNIGGLNIASNSDWRPEAGDWFWTGDDHWVIESVDIDSITFADKYHDLPVVMGPDWYIEGYFDPYFGIIEYDDKYWRDPSVIVLATIQDNAISICHESNILHHRGSKSYQYDTTPNNVKAEWESLSRGKKQSHIVIPIVNGNEIIFHACRDGSSLPWLEASYDPSNDKYMIRQFAGKYILPSDGSDTGNSDSSAILIEV